MHDWLTNDLEHNKQHYATKLEQEFYTELLVYCIQLEVFISHIHMIGNNLFQVPIKAINLAKFHFMVGFARK